MSQMSPPSQLTAHSVDWRNNSAAPLSSMPSSATNTAMRNCAYDLHTGHNMKRHNRRAHNANHRCDQPIEILSVDDLHLLIVFLCIYSTINGAPRPRRITNDTKIVSGCNLQRNHCNIENLHSVQCIVQNEGFSKLSLSTWDYIIYIVYMVEASSPFGSSGWILLLLAKWTFSPAC